MGYSGGFRRNKLATGDGNLPFRGNHPELDQLLGCVFKTPFFHIISFLLPGGIVLFAPFLLHLK